MKCDNTRNEMNERKQTDVSIKRNKYVKTGKETMSLRRKGKVNRGKQKEYFLFHLFSAFTQVKTRHSAYSQIIKKWDGKINDD